MQVSGLTGYRGHSARIQITPADAIASVAVTAGALSSGGHTGQTVGTVFFIQDTYLQSSPPFTDITTFPATVFGFSAVTSSSFSGDVTFNIVENGEEGIDARVARNMSIQASDGDPNSANIPLNIVAADFPGGIANAVVTIGGVGDTPTPTPTVEEPTATPTPTQEEPTATPTETSPLPVGAQIVMDGFGGFHPAGNAPDLLNKESFYPGFDIVRDFEILPDNSGVVAVDGYGASIVLPFPGASPKLKGSLQEIDRTVLPPFTPGLDQYTALVTTADSAGYWVMNEGGQIFGVGSGLPVGATDALLLDLALDLTPDATSGVNRGVDFAVVQDGGVQAIIVLTSYGNQLVPAGDVSTIGLFMSNYEVASDGTYAPPYFGWDIARDIDLEPNGQGYMILDGFGGIHPMGGGARATYDSAFLNGPRPGMPAEAGGHVYFGWDVAKKIDYTSDGLGLIMLDAFGGVHFDGMISPAYGAYFNFDIARDVELYEVIAN
jgi:hypothetical protein